jgi:hypothetical protein
MGWDLASEFLQGTRTTRLRGDVSLFSGCEAAWFLFRSI